MGLENSFVAWATIAGGVAGLMSAAFVVYEKITKGPKIVCEVRKAIYEENSNQGLYFTIIFDIGNVGSEMSTLKKVFLEIDKLFYNKQSYDVQKIGKGFLFQIDDLRTQPILPGEAIVSSFRFHRDFDDKVYKGKTFSGRLRLELLNHSNVFIPVLLSAEKE